MNKTILITGCSSGIGKASAALFASKGWNIVATMRNPAGSAAGGELSGLGNVLVTRLDVQDRSSIEQAVAAGIARFGRLDALVNNAGYGIYGLFEGASREKIQEQFDVNVFGVMDVTRAVLPHFRANKAGLVINISSGAGLFTLPLISLYCASKFALEGFSEALSYELSSQNIVLKLVTPHGGVTSTSFNTRAAEEHAQGSSLADYGAFIAATNEQFQKMRAGSSVSAADIAQVIFSAATDGSRQLRYLVGDDSRGFVKARRELTEQGYVDYMRERFLPGQ